METVALHLEATGQLRHLIQFVEAWSERVAPTPRAQLALAGAYGSLKQMDRAWLRVKDLLDGEQASFEAKKLAARLCMDRGWISRARSLLDDALSLRPDDPLLGQWSNEVALLADRGAEELEDDPSATFEAQLWLAERFLAANHIHKARVVLERLRRVDENHKRVSDLLWGLDGDFSIEGTLGELCDRLGPDLSYLSDLPDDADHTESVNPDELVDEAPDSPSFPNLFRGMDGATAEFEPDLPEVTEVREMASPGQLQRAVDELTPVAKDGDTQILHVVHHDRLPEGARMHRAEPDIDSAFDLARFRREMGMKYGSDLADALEEEDEDVILLTHKDRDDPLPRESTENLDVIELDPTDHGLEEDASDADTVILTKAKPSEAVTLPPEPTPVSTPTPTPPPPPEATPLPPPRDSSDEELDIPQRIGAAPWWGLILFVLLLFALGLTFIALVLTVLT